MQDPPAEQTNDHTPRGPVLFECGSTEVGTREYPHIVDWRAVPSALVMQVRGGSYVVDFTDERHTLRSGEAVIVPPETQHHIHMPNRGSVTVLYAHVNYTTPDGLDLFATLDMERVVRGEPARKVGEVNALLAKCSREMSPGLMRTARLQELGFRLLQVLLSCSRPSQLGAAQPGAQRLLPVLRYVARNLDRPLTRTALAREANLSPTRFHDVFKGHLGVAPMAYVQQQRMSRAKRMLLNTDLSVFQVAARAGFEDPYYFSRVFHRSQGCSPSAFRKAVRGSGL
jgi:AraC-like DNA-binding protein